LEKQMNHSATHRSTTVLVMQHDPLLCAGIVAALRQHPAFEVFVDDSSGDMGETPIDVVVADYSHAMSLVDPAARAAHRPLAAARILALTANDREGDIRRAIEAGIHGYLLLGGPLSELVEGVTMVASGVRYLCRSVAQRMADSLTHASLTSREIEVLQLVAIGESNKAIARELHIELGTVKSHMGAIMTKLNAASRTQAARIATARGLVEEPALDQPVPAQRAQLLPRASGFKSAIELRPQFA
jgi:two-component system NarL family response regulator